MNYDEQLNVLSKKLNVAKDTKNRAEWRLEELKKEEKKLNEEIQALGLKPEDLESHIKSLEKEMEELFQKAESLLPKDLK
ncbi:hypothetical protein LQU94_02600 [Peptoniphilus sp. KCTC 25270]|uniref:hypothetical protein n=1 Tax=Peptoniphilus sp. KCTC 25270 TaxID=2897414 RepID=UPI001E32D618|nr:hypothetical protein [Peptoniphilus sp. KCTC 25270]MCD1147004.1 hypothetical protein [Peptoniphilus sp. KCTC 25270]